MKLPRYLCKMVFYSPSTICQLLTLGPFRRQSTLRNNAIMFTYQEQKLYGGIWTTSNNTYPLQPHLLLLSEKPFQQE